MATMISLVVPRMPRLIQPTEDIVPVGTTLSACAPPSLLISEQHSLNWVTPMGMTLRTIALTLNEMRIQPAEVFRGKIKFK